MNKDTLEMFERVKRLGVSSDDASKLRRIAMQLHRWHELECGVDAGGIERDEEGDCIWYNNRTGKRLPYHDRETPALLRLASIMARYPDLLPYVQSDPRGAALYLVPCASLGDRDIEANYSSLGVSIYK